MKIGEIIRDVECIEISNQGVGIAFVEDRKVFIEQFLPEEIADIRITKLTNKYVQAEMIELKKESPERVTPKCTYFGKAGGSTLQHMSEKLQLEVKQLHAERMMTFGARSLELTFDPMVASPLQYGYRNKAYFTFLEKENGEIVPALFQMNSGIKVPVENCTLISDSMNDVLSLIVEALNQTEITLHNAKTNRGELKRVCIRENHDKSEVMIIFVTKKNSKKVLYPIVDMLSEIENIQSIYMNIQPENTPELLGDRDIHLGGAETIVEVVNGLEFELAPQTFFQTNPLQTVNLYNKALSYLDKEQVIIDFYCGIGTLSLLASKHAEKVIGIELNASSVEMARTNAETNDITNVEFYAMDAKNFLAELPKMKDQQIAVIIDPPRQGCSHEMLQDLLATNASKIIYVSCNPATLARDMEILTNGGYKQGTVALYDMFPQTMHVETVVLMSRVDK